MQLRVSGRLIERLVQACACGRKRANNAKEGTCQEHLPTIMMQ